VSIETVHLKARRSRDILLFMAADLVEVHVHRVVIEGGDGLPVVILLDRDRDAGLALPVGPFEASAIIIELEGISPPRPLTHDLLAELFREGGLSLERAELYGELGSGGWRGLPDSLGLAFPEGGFRAAGAPLARLVYRRGLRRREREVRPSDAIALALRLGAPICAERGLLGSRAEAEAAMRSYAPGPELHRQSAGEAL